MTDLTSKLSVCVVTWNMRCSWASKWCSWRSRSKSWIILASNTRQRICTIIIILKASSSNSLPSTCYCGSSSSTSSIYWLKSFKGINKTAANISVITITSTTTSVSGSTITASASTLWYSTATWWSITGLPIGLSL